ncbi:hypothetical protein [Hymenobacter properus]|uniref:Lipoprotein n=1 Tax=Hymenobacter properus TaxID=2791026 RepID=A0A931BDT6_9BACT|nr:hypothetical protein [Hymenobacter properus]MBF9140462.1 hypothetical protein [Hymenobacter properus]MBR7719269.1 hypothetical protein [Microvirga sp. SRT04]
MKALYATGFLLFPLLMGCQADTSEAPKPAEPTPRVYVHFQLTGAKDAFITYKVQTHPLQNRDSVAGSTWYSVIKDNWDTMRPVQLRPREFFEASINFPTCGGVRQVFPVGAKILGEMIVDGEVRQRTEFTANPTAVNPPEWIRFSLSYNDLH